MTVLPGPVNFSSLICLAQGIFWIVLATVSEIPPAVCFYSFSNPLLRLIPLSQVFLALNLNCNIFRFPSSDDEY
jgi:hypothetical protein